MKVPAPDARFDLTHSDNQLKRVGLNALRCRRPADVSVNCRGLNSVDVRSGNSRHAKPSLENYWWSGPLGADRIRLLD
jgi:hypothetical protein